MEKWVAEAFHGMGLNNVTLAMVTLGCLIQIEHFLFLNLPLDRIAQSHLHICKMMHT